MKKLISIILFLILGFNLIGLNQVNATSQKKYKKRDIPYLINRIVNKKIKSKEKRRKIMEKQKVQNFIFKMKNIYYSIYGFNTFYKPEYKTSFFTKETINSIIIDGEQIKTETNKDLIHLDYNPYRLYKNEYYNEKKEELREKIILELIKRNLLNIDEDFLGYYVDTNLKGELYVEKNDYAINKKDLIGEYLDQLLLEAQKKSGIKIYNLNQEIEKNLYLNYVIDNKSVKKVLEKEIDFNKLSKSLIIRNTEDFKKMFKVTSYRYRSGYAYDPEYRRYNIKQIYDTMKGNKLVLYPGQTISFNQIYLKGDNGTKFKKGSIIRDGEVEEGVYGGGVCGAATGMYQGSIYNKYIKTNARPHSIWYNMYRASINGQKVYTPGLDATYFTNIIDLRLTNTGQYPILMINRIVNGIEENFTLSMKYVEDDKISGIKFLYRKNYNEDDEEKKRSCFTWLIDGKYKTSCYKKIASEEKVEKKEH